MKLVDLRKHAIKNQVKLRFRLSNGMECVMSELGVAQVPGLDRVPEFNLERELESASVFVVEPLDAGARNGAKPRTLARAEMAALVTAGPPAAHHDDHDDD